MKYALSGSTRQCSTSGSPSFVRRATWYPHHPMNARMIAAWTGSGRYFPKGKQTATSAISPKTEANMKLTLFLASVSIRMPTSFDFGPALATEGESFDQRRTAFRARVFLERHAAFAAESEA